MVIHLQIRRKIERNKADKRWDISLLLVFGLFLTVLVPSYAQQRRGGFPNLLQRSDSSTTSLFLLPTPPRELQRSVIKVRQALQEGRYADAVEQVDRLMADPEIGDYFVDQDDEETVAGSFRDQVLRLLGELPKEAQQLYELQFGADAKRDLDEAIQRFDIDAIRNVSRRYLCTQAGLEATLLLVRYHLDQQLPTTAMMQLRRLQDMPGIRQRMEPDFTVLMSMAWMHMGREAEALQTIHDGQLRTQEATRTSAELAVEIPSTDQEILAWLRGLAGMTSRPERTELPAQRFGSGDDRVVDGMPLPHVEWHVSNTLSDADYRLLTDLQRRNGEQEVASIPVSQPLVAGGFLIMRTPTITMGVQVRTGLRRWIYPATLPSSDDDKYAAENDADRSTHLASLHERIWDDAVHATSSTDGQRLYFLTQDGKRQVPDPSQVAMWQRGFGADIDFPQWRNQLVALELATEGKIRWVVGGEDGDEPRLADAYFLGPPLAVLGELYAIAEMRDEIRLVALDPNSGKLRWSQQLLHFEAPFSVAVDPCRRMMGAVPSYADGVLVCPTSAERIVAVDPTSRSLLWGMRYGRTYSHDTADASMRLVYGVGQLAPSGQRWLDSSAIVAGTAVLFTPVETDRLIGLDLLTGKPLWPAIPRGEGLYVGGVVDNIVAVVERRRVRSHDLLTGRESWQPIDLPPGSLVAGRGFVNGPFLYVPTTAPEILKIDLRTGSLVEQMATDAPLGNITSNGSFLISYSADMVRAFYLRDHMREQLTEAIAASPDDPDVLQAYANLLVGDGKLREAIEVLTRCRDLRSDSAARSATERILSQTLLNALKRDFATYRDLLPLARDLFQAPDELNQLLRLSTDGYMAAGDHEAALGSLLQLAESLARSPAGTPVELQRHPRSEDLRLSDEVWLEAMLTATASSGTAAKNESLDDAASLEKITTVLAQIAAIGTPRALRLAVALSPSDEIASPWRWTLAERLLEQGDPLGAELVWSRSLASPERDEQLRAAVALSKLFREGGDPYRSREVMATANLPANGSSDGSSSGAKNVADEWKLVEDAISNPKYQWAMGMVRIQQDSNAVDAPSLQQVIPFEFRHGSGPLHDGWVAVFDIASREILIVDDCGHVRVRFGTNLSDAQFAESIGNGPLIALACGDVWILSIGTRLFAVDLLNSSAVGGTRILWQHDAADPAAVASDKYAGAAYQIVHQRNPFAPDARSMYTRVSSNRLVVGPLYEESFCYAQGQTIECLDPETGHVRWRCRNVGNVTGLFGDREKLFVMTDGTYHARVHSMRDGEYLGDRKVPPLSRHWTTYGDCILTFDEKVSLLGMRRHHLILWNAWSESPKWSMRFLDGARGCLIGRDQLGIIDTKGLLKIFNVLDGSVAAETKLETNGDVGSLSVDRGRDRLVCYIQQLSASALERQQRDGIQIHGPMRGMMNTPFSGQIMAFDRRDGSACWNQPARVQQFYLPSIQGVSLPILPLYRAVLQQASRRAGLDARARRGMRQEMVCLDLRSGTVAGTVEPPPLVGQVLITRGDPANDVVQIVSDSRMSVRVTLTDEPPEPGEPADLPPVEPQADGEARERAPEP